MNKLFADEPLVNSKRANLAVTAPAATDATRNPTGQGLAGKPINVTAMINSITAQGQNEGQAIATIANKFMAAVRASDADNFGLKLNELVGLAKKMDPKAVNGSFLSRITSLFSSAKQGMLNQFNSVETQMDALIAEIDADAQHHAARVTDFEVMFDENYANHQALLGVIERTQLQVANFETQLAEMKSSNSQDAQLAQSVRDLQEVIDEANKYVNDLQRMVLVAKQSAPQIRMLQANARSIVQKFVSIKTVTIPAWKRAFTLALAVMEQKQSAELATTIDDATDAAFRQQADLMRDTSVQIANNKQRAVISTETLQHMNDQLFATIDELVLIEQEGQKARKASEQAMSAMERSLIAKFMK